MLDTAFLNLMTTRPRKSLLSTSSTIPLILTTTKEVKTKLKMSWRLNTPLKLVALKKNQLFEAVNLPKQMTRCQVRRVEADL